MEPLSFTRYLLSKRSVDDRALNSHVWRALKDRLAGQARGSAAQVLELGAGVGTMFQRMVEWGLLEQAEYTLLDEMSENISAAQSLIALWAARQGLALRQLGTGLQLESAGRRYTLELAAAEAAGYLQSNAGRQWDLLVANAFLDLLDVPAVLPLMKAALRPEGMMYLTINFDGLTALEPAHELDRTVIDLYHRTMDERVTAGKPAGDSQTGRHLFAWLQQAGLQIVEAGSSDWVVFPRDGQYQQDEAYFLGFILHFFEESLSQRAELSAADRERWLSARKLQLERGELIFMAHQYDFLVETA